jgi:hypothetical protein
MTDTCKGYSTNKPTRIACSWFTSDRTSSTFAKEVIKRSKDDYQAANELHAWLKDHNPLNEVASPYIDLLEWALSIVDYQQVVEHLKAEID